MDRFNILVKYMPMIRANSVGEWIIGKENNGASEHPMQMSFVDYSEMVHNFINDVYTFEENNKDMEPTRYGDTIENNGLKWSMESMENADVSNLNAQCVLAPIMSAVRAERFCDGAFLISSRMAAY